MPNISETVYPVLDNTVNLNELSQVFTPTEEDINFISETSRGAEQKLYLMVMLKVFQKIGYFVMFKDIPSQIIEYISKSLSMKSVQLNEEKYDSSNTRNNHIKAIRDYLKVKPFEKDAKKVAIKNCH